MSEFEWVSELLSEPFIHVEGTPPTHTLSGNALNPTGC